MTKLEHYAHLFGLPVEQIHFFDDLSQAQKDDVAWHFSLTNASSYVYAVKRDGSLVASRHKREPLLEGRDVDRPPSAGEKDCASPSPPATH